MNKKKKYVVTGLILTALLVSSVLIIRSMKSVDASISSQNLKTKGMDGAPIHIVVYSDFQCPACKAALEPTEELRKEFSEVSQIEFRHFPLERPHRWALTAASFAECAAEQGKFWEFHDRVYAEQASWAQSSDAITIFANYSRELGINPEILTQCLGEKRTVERIRRERESGEKKGVQSTPTIFVNDQILVGGIQLKEKGKGIILEELKKKGVNHSSLSVPTPLAQAEPASNTTPAS